MAMHLIDVEVIHDGTHIGNLEVWQCDCGFNIGIDASYLEHGGSVEEKGITVTCPACKDAFFIEFFE